MDVLRVRRGLGRSAVAFLGAVAFVGGFWPGSAAAQSYGGGDQVLTIAAPSFQGMKVPGEVNPADGYSYVNDSQDPILYAPVNLPDGAVITQICLYARNEHPTMTPYVRLEAVKLAPGGQAPGVVPIQGAGAAADFHFGYGVVCSDPIAYTFHDTADVDHDGTDEHIAHRLYYSLGTNDTSPVVGLGGVRITWHRAVSPPPAIASFTDVPTTSGFFAFVEALYAAGITSGYPDGRFGVNDSITRGQMAVFLSAALGLHWPS